MIVMELLITIHIITHLSVILKTITYISINNYHYQSSSAILSFQLIRAGLTKNIHPVSIIFFIFKNEYEIHY